MTGPVHTYFSGDHARLDELLQRAAEDPAHIDEDAYGGFRSGIAKHIRLEERLLIPALQRTQPGAPLAFTGRIRLDHGAIVALLVPPPTRKIVALLKAILADHNLFEERPGGLYEQCDTIPGADRDRMMDAVRSAPEVPLHPFNTSQMVLDAARRAAARAGYDFDRY